ncbi:CRINKLY4 related 3 [Tasmannia lanceolata]|uniref:CRINKLY4 related 3 n=1 Tax=Tasmannia lanceolata TaxID=3420 RepID=UPI004062D388
MTIITFFFILFLPAVVHGLGSGGTVAVSYGSATVCGILAGKIPQSIECVRRGVRIPISPNVSFDSISGGRNFFCGLRSGGSPLLCWDTGSFQPKRIYNGSIILSNLSVGDDHICALENGTGIVRCWRGGINFTETVRLQSVTSGRGFSCGIGRNSSNVHCWGRDGIGQRIENLFRNDSMLTLVAGDLHVCGVNTSGFVVCRGRNDSGQCNSPSGPAFEFSGLALEVNRSCAIRQSDGTLVCWGGGGVLGSLENDTNFESIVAGGNFSCGLMTRNLTLMCWGLSVFNPGTVLSLPKIAPGPCIDAQSECSCGIYPDSANLCSGSGIICRQCVNGNGNGTQQSPPPLQPVPSPPASPSPPGRNRMNRGLLAFAIVGSVGAFLGICSVIYWLWSGICRHKKVHNSVQPTITAAVENSGMATPTGTPFGVISRSSTIRRQSSRAMRRQRSGTSSKHADRAEEFTLSELAAATNNFSVETKIGSGSFGTVYKGKLSDGREVAIKRGDTGQRTKKFQEKENAFQSELAFLSRLHHKHLVGLVGFCEEREERLLVYEFMKNGALYDHLHLKESNNSSGGSGGVLNSWKMRIKISLDAARGIEYLHNYAVPPIIHRDIKSSNILLDSNWTARVSDFGLSLMGPELEGGLVEVKAAGTVGYMDPEYYGLHHLTAKSDVYGLGVVLLEVLTGKRAIFKSEEEEGGGPTSVVDYAVPKILAGELAGVLDRRVGLPGLNEAEAVELMAYTAVHCVNLEGKDRPTMTDIVANLERALALCDDSHGSISISSATLSLVSD